MSVAKERAHDRAYLYRNLVVNLDVSVDYFTDCAETKPYLTKVYTNQIGINRHTSSAMRVTRVSLVCR